MSDRLARISNRKPADELADVRERMKALREREAILREQMISGDVDLTGDSYEVIISKTKTEKVDTAAMKRELGLKALRPFLTTVESTFVKLRKL